jgi:PAS domain-containing protein
MHYSVASQDECFGSSDATFESEVARLIAPISRSVLDAVIAVDGRGIILAWNDLAASTFGWTREEALGRNMGELIVPARWIGNPRLGYFGQVKWFWQRLNPPRTLVWMPWCRYASIQFGFS